MSRFITAAERARRARDLAAARVAADQRRRGAEVDPAPVPPPPDRHAPPSAATAGLDDGPAACWPAPDEFWP